MNIHKEDQEDCDEEFKDPENRPEGVVIRSKSNLKYLSLPRKYACKVCDKKFESPSKVSRYSWILSKKFKELLISLLLLSFEDI